MPAAKPKRSVAASQTAAPAPLPSWPRIERLPYEDDTPIVTHRLPRQIVTIANFWSPSLCKRYVSFLSTLPLATTPGVPKRGEAVRVNDRFQVHDSSMADLLWRETGLRDLVQNMPLCNDDGSAAPASLEERRAFWGGDVLGLNDNLRIYRYSPGQFFAQHYDDANQVTHPDGPGRTTWTLLLYLTSSTTGCVGGETVFYPDPPKKRSEPSPEPVVVALETGMALLHRHGKDCMLHEGRPVTSGEKWVIRSDLVVKR